jgi:hypothetical protein
VVQAAYFSATLLSRRRLMKATNKSLLTIQPTDWLTYFTFKLHNTPALSFAPKLLPKPFTSEALREEE